MQTNKIKVTYFIKTLFNQSNLKNEIKHKMFSDVFI